MKRLFEKNKTGRSGAWSARRITILAFLVAIALVVSLIESMLPPAILIAPGAKLGLGNVSPLLALIVLGTADALIVTALKCLLGALITGGISGLMYSVPSGILAIGVEIVLFTVVFDKISIPMISLIGAIVFNCVQLLVASLVTGVNLITLLPWLVTAGFVAGAFTGLLTYYIVKKLPYSVYAVRRSDDNR
ncbi:MAG: Gx transporter family protein [Clostridiales bacterium]|nr:Gx transporter family protein [Clostridiales bacterium]